MHLTHDYGQYDYYRAFIPGEPCPLSGHITQMPAYFLASGVPNATSSAGDPTGFLMGNIAGSHDVFLFDTHGGARRNRRRRRRNPATLRGERRLKTWSTASGSSAP